MKLVLFSDLHLDTGFAGLPPEVGRGRRQALREALRCIVDLAVSEGAEALLCGGDLYEHERFSPDTAAFVREVFAGVSPLPVYLAPGNHDWLGPQSLYRQVDWTPNVHVFHEDRLEAVTLAEGLTLWGAAHRAPANTDGFLDHFQVDRGGVHVALFHGSEQGLLALQGTGKKPHAPFTVAQISTAGLHHVLLGHYHTPRDDARLTYPGNPEPLSFGEEGERGAVIVEVQPDGSVSRERRRVARSQVHDCGVDVSGCGSRQEVRDRVAAVVSGLEGTVRVRLSGELAPDVDLERRDFDGLATDRVTLVTRIEGVRVGYDLVALAQEPTVRGQFVRDVRAADLPEDRQRRIIVTGLRALAGRNDLEVP